jgi:uncharacterized protein
VQSNNKNSNQVTRHENPPLPVALGFLLYDAFNIDRACSLGGSILLAGSSEQRRSGLLKSETLVEGSGLWISPCEAIHTFRMKFAIDVVFLSRERRVLKIYSSVAANRICFCLRGFSVLELPAGIVEASGTRILDQIDLR